MQHTLEVARMSSMVNSANYLVEKRPTALSLSLYLVSSLFRILTSLFLWLILISNIYNTITLFSCH